MPQKQLKKPGNWLRHDMFRVAVGALICVFMTVLSAGRAEASGCGKEFRYRDQRLCGMDTSAYMGAIQRLSGKQSPEIPTYVFRDAGDGIFPSLTNAFYPLAGLDSYSTDMRKINIQIENYMLSLIFPLSTLKEQYDILRMLIEERKE